MAVTAFAFDLGCDVEPCMTVAFAVAVGLIAAARAGVSGTPAGLRAVTAVPEAAAAVPEAEPSLAKTVTP